MVFSILGSSRSISKPVSGSSLMSSSLSIGCLRVLERMFSVISMISIVSEVVNPLVRGKQMAKTAGNAHPTDFKGWCAVRTLRQQERRGVFCPMPLSLTAGSFFSCRLSGSISIPKDSSAVTPSSGSALSFPKSTVPPTISLISSIRATAISIRISVPSAST